MKKMFAIAVAISVLSAPAFAQNSGVISGSFGHTDNTSAAVSHGLAVGVATGAQAQTGITAGVSVSTGAPGGNLTATVSQNQNAGVSQTFAAGDLGGNAAAANVGNNFGAAGSLAFH